MSKMDLSRGSRQRVITACLTCRRRKVKCDHKQPACSACQRGNHTCSYLRIPSDTRSRVSPVNRVSRSNGRARESDLRDRLDRLEKLLERAISTPAPLTEGIPKETTSNTPPSGEDRSSPLLDKETNSKTLSADGYDGALLLDSKGGNSHWVSSLHYALLADEIHDVKLLLTDVSTTDGPENMPCGQADISFPFSGASVESLSPWLPLSPEHCFSLLETFFSNVDPVARIVHKPLVRRRMTEYVSVSYPSDSQSEPKSSEELGLNGFEPLLFAIFYAAVNSMGAEAVFSRFGAEKRDLLTRYQHGVELGLGREKFLTTSSIEVLQAFVLFLSCQSKEDNMSKIWTVLGLVTRLAIAQGLHREPSLFASGSMDVVQVELRRRLWHQICYLDFRSGEGKGQEPSISDEDYTTLLPRNINDDDLIEGQLPSPGDDLGVGVTDMTNHLIRLNGVHCFRRIVKKTYRLERRLKASSMPGGDWLDPAVEIQTLFADVKKLVDDMASHLQDSYLQYCDVTLRFHRICIGFATILEWRAWSLLWSRTPREYRETIISSDFRSLVFEKSVNLIESLNTMVKSQDAEPYLWHISGHSCFQAIMHVISELKNPGFQSPKTRLLCGRALSTLQQTETQQHGEFGSSWKAMNRIISNFIAQYPAMRSSQTQFEKSTVADGIPYRNSVAHETHSSLPTGSHPADTRTGPLPSTYFSPPENADTENFDIQFDHLDVANLDWGSWEFDTSIIPS